MDTNGKKKLFLAITVLLLAMLIAASAAILMRGPRDSSVQLLGETATEYIVDDLYEGEMSIPKYNLPGSQYKPGDFVESKGGVISYTSGDSFTGINVNEQKGEIDWQQVAASGVEYAMIRVGYREYRKGSLLADKNFETNIKGALDAGLPVGVYFFSQAITDAEAEEEASFVLEKIRGYSVTYPVAFYWEYKVKDDGTPDEGTRTVRCNGSQVTGFINTFCKKVKSAGFTAAYYCDKNMGYTKLDLSQLSAYEMWYAEFRSVPSFYYDFGMWQYTKEGTVPGISKEVPISLALKKYGK